MSNRNEVKPPAGPEPSRAPPLEGQGASGFQRPSNNDGGGRKPPPSRYIHTTEEEKSSLFEKCAVFICWIFVVLFFPLSLCCCILVVPEYIRLIVLRLGRLRKGAKGPGLVFFLPCIDGVQAVDMRTDVYKVWPQDVLTKDSVTITVNAVIYYCIYDAIDSIIQVDNVKEATLMIAKVTLRNIVGSKTLNVLLTSRQALSREIQEAVAEITARWGVRMERVDLMDIILPSSMERSLASEAEAVREARAKIILAEGELKASKALKEASDVMAQNKITLQLRHLQILSSIATERRVRIIYPIPMEIMEPFMDSKGPQTVTVMASTSGGSGGAGRSGGGGGNNILSNFFIGGTDETQPSGTDTTEPKGQDEPGFSGTLVPEPHSNAATNLRSTFVAVNMDRIQKSPLNLMQRDDAARTSTPGPVGRLTFMDLESYRDFLRVRW